MGLGDMICIPSFIKSGSGIQKLMGGVVGDSQRHRHHGDRISLLSFFFSKYGTWVKNGFLRQENTLNSIAKTKVQAVLRNYRCLL
jgi:hypothetical protein